jgi:hypothetical protein
MSKVKFTSLLISIIFLLSNVFTTVSCSEPAQRSSTSSTTITSTSTAGILSDYTEQVPLTIEPANAKYEVGRREEIVVRCTDWNKFPKNVLWHWIIQSETGEIVDEWTGTMPGNFDPELIAIQSPGGGRVSYFDYTCEKEGNFTIRFDLYDKLEFAALKELAPRYGAVTGKILVVKKTETTTELEMEPSDQVPLTIDPTNAKYFLGEEDEIIVRCSDWNKFPKNALWQWIIQSETKEIIYEGTGFMPSGFDPEHFAI